MSPFPFYRWFLLSVVVSFSSFLFAQPPVPIKPKGQQVIRQQSVLLQVTDTTGIDRLGESQSVPRFRNLTRYRPYRDPALLNEMRKLEKDGKDSFDELEKSIKKYVGRFGIGNFSDSSSITLIWKLGRLRELAGDTATALFYYELAAKHRRVL